MALTLLHMMWLEAEVERYKIDTRGIGGGPKARKLIRARAQSEPSSLDAELPLAASALSIKTCATSVGVIGLKLQESNIRARGGSCIIFIIGS